MLAAALGPKGGIALTIGDGLVRWDRRQTGPWQSQWIEPSAVASARLQLGTGRVVSTEIEESLVRSSLHRLPAAGAHEMRILMASDGVGNSVQHSLESTWFDSTGECARYLLHLAANLPDTLQTRQHEHRLCRKETSAMTGGKLETANLLAQSIQQWAPGFLLVSLGALAGALAWVRMNSRRERSLEEDLGRHLTTMFAETHFWGGILLFAITQRRAQAPAR